MERNSRIANPLFGWLLIAAAAALALSCKSPMPQLQQGPDAEVTHDGLVRVDRSRMQQAWMKPDADLSQYTKFTVGPPVFRFKAVRGSGRTARTGQDAFYISEENRKRLVEEVRTVFRDELSKSQYFQRVEEPGPDVLLLEGAMLDIVSRVPPQMTGRGDVFLSSVGEATIVLQLADSETGEVLARAVERRAAQEASSTVQRSSPVTTWAEVRRLARRWARILRERLDQLHELGPIGQTAAAD